MNFETTASLWAIAGLVLLITEVLTQTFVFFFLGIAALAVAGTKVLGLNHPSFELILFSIVSLGLIGLLRKKLLHQMHSPKKAFTQDEQVEIVLSSDLPANGTGTIEYQGVPWSALNVSAHPLKKGEVALIERADGLQLRIKPKSV